jgi:hypothetical protein
MWRLRSNTNYIFERAAAQLVSVQNIDNFIQLNVQGGGEESRILVGKPGSHQYPIGIFTRKTKL